MRHYIRILALVMVAGGAAACDEKLSSLTGPTPNLEPTFASIQSNIFEAGDSSGRPACINCHTNVGRTPAGGLNLVHDLAYDQLTRASAQRPSQMIVARNNSAASYLIEKLVAVPSAPIVGVRMPRGSTSFLTDGQILVIRRWIDTGAARN